MPKANRKSTAFSRIVKAVVVFLFATCCQFSFAIGPHEIVLVVNDDSMDSILLGKVYKRLRSIPDSNVIRLSLPKTVYDGVSTDISPDDFTTYIWKPLTAKIKDAGIDLQVLACVYSCGFPTCVTSSPPLSITGLTFLRNKPVPPEQVKDGRYLSELFSGPSNASSPMSPSATLDYERNRLLEDMPFPAMMLGFTGKNGATLDELIASLERSAAADFTSPKGTFFFAVNDDVRSTCRRWEYELAAAAIRKFPDQVVTVSTNLPTASDFPLVGFMTGNRTVDTAALTFAPGAYADNLTSFGAAFFTPDHTKVTQWLKSGAAFSSGTVVEPYAIWTKFANACVFVHSLAGCSAIESIYQSVSSPLQLLPVGDPLSKPWAPRLEPVVTIPNGPLSAMVEMSASVKDEDPGTFLRFNWLVDGKIVGSGRTIVWNSRSVGNGVHAIRVVVRRQMESVRHQDFTEVKISVKNGGAK